MRYSQKWPVYAQQWDAMAIKPARVDEFERMARYAIEHKDIYQQIEQATRSHFPWYAVAVAHKRESDEVDEHDNPLFTSYLGNGQPLWIRTTIVPEGRGPFISRADALHDQQKCRAAFVAGGLDALHLEKIDQVVPPWPIEKLLYDEEALNGTGYDSRGLPSPYVWGSTSVQQPGKYIRDHVFDHTVWDQQLGCAGMLWMIAKLDPSVTFVRET